LVWWSSYRAQTRQCGLAVTGAPPCIVPPLLLSMVVRLGLGSGVHFYMDRLGSSRWSCWWPECRRSPRRRRASPSSLPPLLFVRLTAGPTCQRGQAGAGHGPSTFVGRPSSRCRVSFCCFSFIIFIDLNDSCKIHILGLAYPKIMVQSLLDSM
jgi:hypothetical protein